MENLTLNGKDVWKQCCVELLLGYDDNSVYRDYSLAMTTSGPQIFVRRGRGEFTPGLRNEGNRLDVLHSARERIVMYRLLLDPAHECMPELLTAPSFRIGMVVRDEHAGGVQLFNGIGLGEGCTYAATVMN